MSNPSVYVSVGVVSALGLPWASEEIDEIASAQCAERNLMDQLSLFFSEPWNLEFHVDFGDGEMFIDVHYPDGREASASETAWISKEVINCLAVLDWIILRKPYIATMGQWREFEKELRTIGDEYTIDAIAEYLSYNVGKLESEKILITETTPIVLYFGERDMDGVGDLLYEMEIQEAVEHHKPADPATVAHITYPLTALETGFEHDRDCNMQQSLLKLAELWRKKAGTFFPNAVLSFNVYPREKERTGSVTMLDNSYQLLYHPFALESAFFHFGSEAILDINQWFTKAA